MEPQVLPSFTDDQHLVDYAGWFVEERIKIFRRDTGICLRPNPDGDYAYMPTLITCISLLELLSGLYAGKLKHVGITGILGYAGRFMDRDVYTEERLRIMYVLFRHKIAHITKPYGVLDTGTDCGDASLLNGPRRRITWTVSEKRHPLPISIQPDAGCLSGKDYPWDVPYSHRCTVSLPILISDIPDSALGDDGYLAHVATDRQARKNFEKCMQVFFPACQPSTKDGRPVD